MKDPLRQRWIIVWLIWGMVLLLTYCNQWMIGEISKQRALLDVRNMDANFVQKNRHDIDRILSQRAAYRQPVESIQIGCLSLKNKLRTLASTHNLMVLELNSDTDQPVSDTVPINLTFVGSYADALGWLIALEHDHPYAPALQLKIQRAQELQMPQFQVRIQYQFELTGSLTTG
ncbi:MAG: hypothetical protein V2B19_22245 [Pseudomonadota bacterium]